MPYPVSSSGRGEVESFAILSDVVSSLIRVRAMRNTEEGGGEGTRRCRCVLGSY